MITFQARLAALYLPVIGITMETLHQLFDPCYERKLIGGFWSDEEGDRISQRVAMAIAGSTICNRGINVPHMSSNERDIKVSVGRLNLSIFYSEADKAFVRSVFLFSKYKTTIGFVAIVMCCGWD